VKIYFNEYDHAVYNTIFMDIVSNYHPTWTHADSEPASLLNAAYLTEKQKYQFYSLWSDPTGARTYEDSHANLYAAV
jgi:hypothetical protein